MRKYAVSITKFGDTMERAEEYVAAFERSKVKRIELGFFPLVTEDEAADIHGKAARMLKSSGFAEICSIHMPFYGGGKSWDISAIDEDQRKDVSRRHQELIRRNADLMAPLITMHCSNEPPLEEHPARIGQVCRSLEELMPLAEELDFSINVEYLPRRCVGNCLEELQQVVANFDPERVGICMDVNHVMMRYGELPQIIETLAPRIRAFHLSDYDGIDEKHWFPGQGIIDWSSTMAAVDKVPREPLLIFEVTYQLALGARETDPYWHLKQVADGCFFLENCVELENRIRQFTIK